MLILRRLELVVDFSLCDRVVATGASIINWREVLALVIAVPVIDRCQLILALVITA